MQLLSIVLRYLLSNLSNQPLTGYGQPAWYLPYMSVHFYYVTVERGQPEIFCKNETTHTLESVRIEAHWVNNTTTIEEVQS